MKPSAYNDGHGEAEYEKEAVATVNKDPDKTAKQCNCDSGLDTFLISGSSSTTLPPKI